MGQFCEWIWAREYDPIDSEYWECSPEDALFKALPGGGLESGWACDHGFLEGCPAEATHSLPFVYKAKFRLLGKPLVYYQYWQPERLVAIAGPDDPLIREGRVPERRFACWVIDRRLQAPSVRLEPDLWSESGHTGCRIMDFSAYLFSRFCEWKEAYRDDPGGMHGCDWVIRGKVSQTSLGRALERGCGQYLVACDVIPLDRTPITDTEIDIIKNGGVNLHDELINAYKPDVEALRRAAAIVRGETLPGTMRLDTL